MDDPQLCDRLSSTACYVYCGPHRFPQHGDANKTIFKKKNIEGIKRDSDFSWTVYLLDEDAPISLVIPSYVPDIAECHGQYPIDQVEEAETFAQMMEYFPQKEQ